VVIQFLTVVGSSPIKIHRHLKSVCGEDAIDVSSVRHWVRRFKRGGKDIGDRPHSSRPAIQRV
jgi:transposase